jgi:hypothetical protein
MPSFAPAEPRRRLALAALALPIVGMMGMFGWAGAQSAPSATSFVQSFITAYDAGNCQVTLPDLYAAPGAARPTCAELRRARKATFRSCTLSLLTPASTPATTAPPAGYVGEQTVLASCQHVRLDFYVATDTAASSLRILGVQVAP